MPLSWPEIRSRAVAFSREWRDGSRERAEAQTFWNEFFEVFGLRRRHVASFEEPVRALGGRYKYIDLLWRGRLIAEHKSRDGSLERAELQAVDYVQDLIRTGRAEDAPQYVIVSDFARIALHDLEGDATPLTFPLVDLHRHVRAFGFIPGYESRRPDPEDPANFRATTLLAELHDALRSRRYPDHELERFLVRILFCLFAEDTGLFEPDGFRLFVIDRTREDGSDLGPQLARYFDVLNTPHEKRQSGLDDELAALPYVNGALFAERLTLAEMTGEMRAQLLRCADFHWSTISPAIFGSLFQSILDRPERREIGAHYTSERDILRLIRPLFLDDLREDFQRARAEGKAALRRFHERLGTLRFIDPACGCGNFLVITYRELRELEIDVLRALHGVEAVQARFDFDLRAELRVNVDQMHGIEIDEWPCRIAEVAMWLMDHQSNLRVSAVFGQLVARLPLQRSARIVHANALEIDWNEVLPARECSYVLGNPPFRGKKEQTHQQKAEVLATWRRGRGAGVLDYVTCWYALAARYIRGTGAAVAFVSTNSISQGEQVGPLWRLLRSEGSVCIDFAHTTFAWRSDARGAAHVHVVIIGFSEAGRPRRRLFVYETIDAEPNELAASNISPYLTEGPDFAVESRTTPLCTVPPMSYGSMMIDKDRQGGDGAGLVFSRTYRDLIVAETPALGPFVRPILGGEEFLNGDERWCLWLRDATPELLSSSPEVMRRVAGVRQFRLRSGRPQTKELARTPHLFGEIRQPTIKYLLVPKVSSERRDYIPIGFVAPDVIASGSALILPGATIWHFGVLASATHNAWVRGVAGRMKSDLQYSSRLVYNNFPWPTQVSYAQRAAVEAAAQLVLDVRAAHPGSNLAQLYDPLTMPADLSSAHRGLDRAVDRAYRRQPFPSNRHRFEHLLTLCANLAEPLAGKPRRPRRRRT